MKVAPNDKPTTDGQLLVPLPPDFDEEAHEEGDSEQSRRDYVRDYVRRHFIHARSQRTKWTWVPPFFAIMYTPYVDKLRGDLDWAIETTGKRMQGQPFLPWKDFEKERIASKKFPVFLCCCTLLSVIVFIFQFVLSGWKLGDDMTIPEAALIRSRIVEHNERYRLVTSVFMHSDIVHLLTNIALLWLYGFHLERMRGSVFTAAIFTVSAIGASLGRADGSPYGGAVGLSGGIRGLIGIAYADFIVNAYRMIDPWRKFYIGMVAYLGGLLEIIIMVVQGFNPYIDLMGFTFGLCFSIFSVEYNAKATDAQDIQRSLPLGLPLPLLIQLYCFGMGFYVFVGFFVTLWITDTLPGEDCSSISNTPFCFDNPLLGWDCEEYWKRMDEQCLSSMP